MSFVREEVAVDGKTVVLETGKWARQAGGSIVIRIDGTLLLVTATGSSDTRDLPFLPLTCEYKERAYAAGHIPGGFFKREGRPTEQEILAARLMDRPSRPLFPEGWRYDTQIIAQVLSFDGVNPAEVLAITGASAALHISDLVYNGPIAGVRVGYVDGKFVAFPTYPQIEDSAINMIVAASRDAITMVEGEMNEVSESLIIDALMFAHESVQPLIDAQEKLRAAVGKPKRPFDSPQPDEALYRAVRELALDKTKAALAVREKHARYDALAAVVTEVVDKLCAEGAPYHERDGEVKEACSRLKREVARAATLDGVRIDGRKHDEIRPITCEVGVLPAVHGSAVFTRGETQAMAAITLGTISDEQRLDTLRDRDERKRFMLHYNFPPFCTGEVKPLRGTSRREIGHGHLAERSVQRVLPAYEDFPYTIRVVSEVLESNGSSSMATVCGASLALMDGGVPIKAPIAGIAMGLMKEGDRYAVLSDILGDEDHIGDMDFKVTGTADGITALQMDIKVSGLTRDILQQALDQARAGRMHILGEMNKVIAAPRDELSPNAPRIVSIKVKPDKIRDIIGPGGKTIRGIVEQTGAQIDIEDDGTVNIASANERGLQQAIDLIRGLTVEPELGKVYAGVVKRIAEFGAFVEIMPGTDGLVHISELAEERTRKVTDVCEEGDEMVVKVINIDRDGKIRLSRRQALDVAPEDVNRFVG
ncbi:MAG: polyribonucleotide nucleotidyltransferase [Deltaproteobacteria bacterium]|nr:MAG: polyribonucleotide nucleotidyltransferase [Deltaproteobacteria bacterium]